MILKRAEEGTAAWFEEARHKCVDHLRALNAVREAGRYARIILDLWGINNFEVLSALHVAGIISYARPFQYSKSGGGRIFYSTSYLLRSHGFDKDLHRHILLLRDKIIAHSDYDFFPSSTYVQTIGDEEIPVAMGI